MGGSSVGFVDKMHGKFQEKSLQRPHTPRTVVKGATDKIKFLNGLFFFFFFFLFLFLWSPAFYDEPRVPNLKTPIQTSRPKASSRTRCAVFSRFDRLSIESTSHP